MGRRAIQRRELLKMGAAAAVLGATGGLTQAAAARPRFAAALAGAQGLSPAGPELALPPGFSYKTLSPFGSALSDGFPCPPIHDGMGVYTNPGGGYRIVRNHELGSGNDIGPGTVIGRPWTAYDRLAPGGTVTLVVDGDANLVEHYISLNGTDTNCAGAETPWGTWLSCEETTVGTHRGWGKPHGYLFEVDPMGDGSDVGRPIKAAGRFVHEAAAVDPETSVVFMTEDWNPDGFYRYVPDAPGNLLKGGVLQALKVKGHPLYNTIQGETVGAVLPVSWVDIDDPDPDDAERDARAVLKQAKARGAAQFLSGEGCTWRGDSVVFSCGDGGDNGRGQIWQYTPTSKRGRVGEEGELVLLYQSTGKGQLDFPDNLCTSPGGAIVIAEDGDDERNFLRVLLPDGTIFALAENLVLLRKHIIDASGKLYDPTVPDDDFHIDDGVGAGEMAGPRFSPDGKWLFVNIQVPGVTCAITGDWDSLGM